MAREMPPRRAVLSFWPKVTIANDLRPSGVRSMTVLPTASSGEADGAMTEATRWPTATAVRAAAARWPRRRRASRAA